MFRLKMAAGLAAKDWLHEKALSLCAVLALASMLAPVLVLQGIHNGVVSSMREKLMQDPEVLLLTPIGGGAEGSYPASLVEELRSLPGVAFAIGRTRAIANDLTISGPNGRSLTIQMEPCAPGEPTLVHCGLPAPADGQEPEIILSNPAAQALGAGTGTKLTAHLGRRTPEGRLESASITFTLSGILPAEAAGRKMGFAPAKALEDIQDYRDAIAVHERNFSGTPRQGERRYASFRLYAANLDAVEPLAQTLQEKGISARTKAKEIASIKAIDTAVSRVIFIIAIAVGCGFAAFTFSSAQGAVRRKDKMLGMLRLLGFSRLELLCFPLTGTILTAVFGSLLAGILYLGAAFSIERLFSAQTGGLTLCRLSWIELATAAGLITLLSCLSAARAALKAANIEPSSVIREV